MVKTEYYKDLTKMNTFGMKVKARCFIEYDSVADLVDIEFEDLARPVLHIGGGSNLLFTDDFKGTVIHSKINFIEILEDEARHDEELIDVASASPVLVSVGAGVVFDDFCEWAAKEGLWGVENLSYIPGEVGASAVQNIGAYGVEVKDVIRRVYCYDTVEEEFVSFDVEDCEYGYRDSVFKDPEVKGRYVVTHVVFALSREPMPRLEYGHLKEAVSALLSGDPRIEPSVLTHPLAGGGMSPESNA
ncbi:MAG: FAD-binding protein, partial [Bacteroidales bacterium]|nr:FAD-binding protein [Bacteroidales bacterium]